MKNKTIMIVDDELDVRNLVENILKTAGFEVIKVKNGSDCLKKLSKSKPDLILLDFFMPDMSGRQILEEIRNNPKTKDQKVAFLTIANFSNVGLNELNKLDCLDYIRKPFNADNLVKRVKALLK
ncbi:MAG: response regulator [Nanoarchaeota archaeon]|nr:response regulator [Nanoarchaeota archaeon]MBU4242467.1 response regulator [Nanoarchaeota archaeon]MBU4352010.1 response regulator [Nanoarchaeota archaeon]MBU4456813.1 response regulator [Nanoarchaeota archaeon]MCG2719395.1 response regulator [Nanoarchaeota archaeon]